MLALQDSGPFLKPTSHTWFMLCPPPLPRTGWTGVSRPRQTKGALSHPPLSYWALTVFSKAVLLFFFWLPSLFSLSLTSQIFLHVKGVQFLDQSWGLLTRSLKGTCRLPNAQPMDVNLRLQINLFLCLPWLHKWPVLHLFLLLGLPCPTVSIQGHLG